MSSHLIEGTVICKIVRRDTIQSDPNMGAQTQINRLFEAVARLLSRVEWNIVFNGVLAVTAILGALFIWRQLRLTQEQLKLARDQFELSKQQVLGAAADTRDALLVARQAAEAASISARRSEEIAEATARVAQAATQGASAATEGLSLSRKQLEVHDRPWLTAALELAGPLQVAPNGSTSIAVRYAVTNIGRSVATNVEVRGHLIALDPEDPFEGPLKIQQHLCARLVRRHDETGRVGGPIFPGETLRGLGSYGIAEAALRQAAIPFPEKRPDDYVVLLLVGCVVYQFHNSDVDHRHNLRVRDSAVRSGG